MQPFGILEVLDGCFKGRRYDVRPCIRLGRHPENELVLVDNAASLFHAVVNANDTGWVVEDLGSSNGTFVNGNRVKRRSLQEGDVLRVGHTRLRLSVEQRQPVEDEGADGEVRFSDGGESVDLAELEASGELVESADLADALDRRVQEVVRESGDTGDEYGWPRVQTLDLAHRPVEQARREPSPPPEPKRPRRRSRRTTGPPLPRPDPGQARGPLRRSNTRPVSPLGEPLDQMAWTQDWSGGREPSPESSEPPVPSAVPANPRTTLAKVSIKTKTSKRRRKQRSADPDTGPIEPVIANLIPSEPLDTVSLAQTISLDDPRDFWDTEPFDIAEPTPVDPVPDSEPPAARTAHKSEPSRPLVTGPVPMPGLDDSAAQKGVALPEPPVGLGGPPAALAEEAGERGKVRRLSDGSLACQPVSKLSESSSGEGPNYFALYAFLRQACCLVNTRTSLKVVLDEILAHLFSVVPADHGCILLYKPSRHTMMTGAVRSRVPLDANPGVTVSRTIVSKVVKRRVSLLSHDASKDFNADGASSIDLHQISSVLCCPLVFQDELMGVIYLDTRGRPEAFNAELLKAVHAISGPAAVAIKNSVVVEKLRRTSDQVRQSYIDTVTVLANSIEARDTYTIGHGRRVTALASSLARVIGWGDQEIELLKIGCILHDIGKVGVPDGLLLKTSPLTHDEYKKLKKHPQIGANILKDIKFLKPVLPYVLYHHERWDGTGYPAGLAQEAIPFKGRLLAVVDAFDAMTSSRPYRKRMPGERATGELVSGRGTQFDPVLVDAFVNAYKAGRLEILRDE